VSIVGIGIDLVDIERVRRLFTRHGLRAQRRFLTAAEAAYVNDCADPARHSAANGSPRPRVWYQKVKSTAPRLSLWAFRSHFSSTSAARVASGRFEARAAAISSGRTRSASSMRVSCLYATSSSNVMLESSASIRAERWARKCIPTGESQAGNLAGSSRVGSVLVYGGSLVFWSHPVAGSSRRGNWS